MILTLNIQTERQIQFKEITPDLQRLLRQHNISEGTLLIFVPHTTAAVTINENADPDVATDMINGLNKLVPLDDRYLHREGNSAAHIKSSLIGATEQVIIHQGELLLGTWQGIYFCEFDGPRARKIHLKVSAG